MADAKSVAGAGIFLMAVGEAFNVYGALNSSPWTAESFGADPVKARSCRHYVLQADAANIILGVGASIVAESPAPLLGILVITLFMHWQYEKALRKAKRSGSKDWDDGGAPSSSSGPGWSAA